jgi:flagellar biosynthesis GTPase FlhF
MSTATFQTAVPGAAAQMDIAAQVGAAAEVDIVVQDPAARAYAGARARGGAPNASSPDTSATPDDASRVYRGRTVEELIPKIQAELGRDAIVIRRQTGLTGGFAGFFQRPYVEIEARRGSPGIDRYDEDVAAPVMPGELDSTAAAAAHELDRTALADLLARAQPAPAPAKGHSPAPSNGRGTPLDVQDSEDEFRELTAAGPLATPGDVQRVGPAEPEPERERRDAPDEGRPTDPFAAALAEAEAAVSQGQPVAHPGQVQSNGIRPPASPANGDRPGSPRDTGTVLRSRARDAIEHRLRDVGVGEELVRELLEAATVHVMPFMPARTSLLRAVQVALKQRIPTARALPAGNATIAVVGPGGSGKTSCCAALLGAYGKRSALPAACVTIAEGPQRRHLEMLLSPHVLQPVPVDDPQALAALRDAREEGVVLLDTPAVSPGDRPAIRALETLLAGMRADRVVLALPATLGAKATAQLLEALSPLGADAIAITHADETDQLGVIVDAACTFGLAPAYTLERGRGGGLAQVEPSELAERLLGAR